VVEDVVYIGLGLLLAGCSLALLVSGLINFGQNLITGSLTTYILGLLDRVLLILLVVELLYTVQVSFREHALMPEPFLLIGLIAGNPARLAFDGGARSSVREVRSRISALHHGTFDAHGPDCCPRHLAGRFAKAERNGADRTCKMNPGSSSRQPPIDCHSYCGAFRFSVRLHCGVVTVFPANS
jgi:hypothetical protein